MAFSRTNCPYPSDIPANGSANGSSPREKFLGTSENTRWKLRWVEEVGPQPESRAIANAKWLRDNFCLSSPNLFCQICQNYWSKQSTPGSVVPLAMFCSRKSSFGVKKSTFSYLATDLSLTGQCFQHEKGASLVP